MLVITSPFDPVKILLFNESISDPPRARTASAAKVALYISIVLGGSALVGRPVLELLRINLDAFTVVGGLIIVVMGFEMLYGGRTSKAQGDEKRQRGAESGDSLLMPLTLPLIAGPGAITTTITLAARGGSSQSIVVTLIAVGVVALTAFISYQWLGRLAKKAKPENLGIVTRLGGLLLAIIGTQMILGGLKNFFTN